MITATTNNPLEPGSASATTIAKRPGSQASSDFAALTKLGRKLPEGDPQVRQQAAANLLTELFFHPMLAEMRKWPFGAKFATGGRVEEVFGEQLDKRVADTVTMSDPGGITTAIAKSLTPEGRAKLQDLKQTEPAGGLNLTNPALPTVRAGAIDIQV